MLEPRAAPVLIVGAGRMGGALIRGWLSRDVLAAKDLMIVDPQPSEVVLAAAAQGAALNPPDEMHRRADTVVLAVKPQAWRAAAEPLVQGLGADAAIVSVVAGARLADLARAFARERVARVMPNIGVAIGQGVAVVFAPDPAARAAARRLLEPLAMVVDVVDEASLDAATAVAGSGPAYLYAFVEALQAAAVSVGLPPQDAALLARSTVVGAAAMLAAEGRTPEELRREVASPAGTTQAALDVLQPALAPLMREAVRAAAERSRELGLPAASGDRI